LFILRIDTEVTVSAFSFLTFGVEVLVGVDLEVELLDFFGGRPRPRLVGVSTSARTGLTSSIKFSSFFSSPSCFSSSGAGVGGTFWSFSIDAIVVAATAAVAKPPFLGLPLPRFADESAEPGVGSGFGALSTLGFGVASGALLLSPLGAGGR
jgi:hypothetical protein